VSDVRPIGVFDSGVGGLTVLREIVRRLPGESTIYLGDNARTPYGTRTDDEVLAFSTESVDALVARDVKAVVIACNTSTAVALPQLRRRYELPILGVIRPGAAAAALASRNRRVGVIATPATVRSHAYFWAIKEENPAIEVYEHATPSLVPLVEAGQLAGPDVERAVSDELAPLLGQRGAEGEFIFPLPASARIDTLLLGCTHYPLLRSVIAVIAGERVAIVDSATATASAVAELLGVNGLEAEPATPVHRQLTTGDVATFSALAARLFGEEFTDVATVELGGGAGAGGGFGGRAGDTDGTTTRGAPGAAATTATGGER
jgi:glutamate racemase